MTTAHISGIQTVDVTYQSPVDANTLSPTEFTSNPSLESALNAAQLAARQIRLTFNAPINIDTSLTYGVADVGFIAPQTIDYT